MKIDVSIIAKNSGTSLNIMFNENIADLKTYDDGFEFNNPVEFSGQLVNVSGVFKLSGYLKTGYIVKCYRCLKDIKGEMDLEIKEDFVNAEKSTDPEDYTYEGNAIIIDKALKDNIILNLPMKQICAESCKGLCALCGADLNIESCGCKGDTVNPQMETLKRFFKIDSKG